MKKNNQTFICLINKCSKKSAALVLFLIMNLSFTGCMAYMAMTYDSPASNLDKIKEGVDRKTVENILGKPKQKNNNVYTYEYNTREFGGFWGPLFFDVMTFGTSAIYYSDFKKMEKAEKTKMRIIYGPRETVVNMNYDFVESKYIQWLNSSNREAKIELLCISANSGYAHAQAIQAMMHRYGLWDTEIDNIKAYRWLKLADFGGQENLKEIMNAWAKNMTPDEIKEAEKSFRDWEPESCEK